LRIGDIVLLLQRILRVTARIRAGACADNTTCAGANRGTASTADGRAQSGTQSRTKQCFADSSVVGLLRTTGNTAAGKVATRRIVLFERRGLFIRARHHGNGRTHRWCHAA
jgi:hypothetical protein